MKRLHSFIRLPATKRWLLIRAALLLGVMRLGLWLLPFQTLRRLLARFALGPTRVPDTEQFSKSRVVWAVETASRHMPSASTCLTQALVVQTLLARRGYPAVVYIGVVREDRDELQAHAWVKSEGEVVIGGYELDRYTPLATLGVEQS
jgi:Transglutaminase-like superfamily